MANSFKLSPIETRLVNTLLTAKGREASIDVLFAALESGAMPGLRRTSHQIVGSYVARINKKMAKAGSKEVIRPGKARASYRVWRTLAAWETHRAATKS